VQAAQPEAFGFAVLTVKVTAVPFVALAGADRLPPGGFVTRALVGLRVSEGLAQQRPVVEAFQPMIRQRAHGRTERLGRKIRLLTALREQQESPVLHHQRKPFDPARRIPADPTVPVLERIAGRTPRQQRHRPAPTLDYLTQVIAHRLAGSQIVPIVQLRIEPLVLGRRGHPHLHVSIPALVRRVADWCFRFCFRFHPTQTNRKLPN